MNRGETHLLSELSWKTIRETEYDIAVLPWGATEPHNYHLPYGTDVFESSAIAELSAKLAAKNGAAVVVLPCVPFGVNTGQLDLKLTLNMNPSTQLAILTDLVASLSQQGIRKLLILNGHGGNDFRQMIRELQPRSDVFVSTINWWSCVDPSGFFDEPGDHAGELETSVMMALRPDLVLPLAEAGAGHTRKFRIRGLREGWVWAPRKWTEVSEDTGTGNPKSATLEKGERFLKAVTERIASYLTELAGADLDSMYE